MADEIAGIGRGLEALLASGPIGAISAALMWWTWRKDGLDRERSKAAGERADQRERDHAKGIADQRMEFLAVIDRLEARLEDVHEKHVASLERTTEIVRLTLDTVTRRALEKRSNGHDTKAGPIPGPAD